MQTALNRFWALALIPVVILVDQWTKYMVLAEPRFNAIPCLDSNVFCGAIAVDGPINLTMLWNRGMSYGLFQSEGIMRWVLSAVMFIIACFFLSWLFKAQGRILKLALALIVGGAFGNLIDRVRFGAVVDFIDVREMLPFFVYIFNVADSAISVGAVLLFLDQFLLSGRNQATTPVDPDKTN